MPPLASSTAALITSFTASFTATLRRLAPALAPSALALLVASATAAALLFAAGYEVSGALRALMQGAFGSPHAWSETLVKAIPLALTGLAVGVAFRAGVWNIGAEGQLLAGALLAIAAAPHLASLPKGLGLALLFLSGALAGGAWGAIAGWLKVRRGVPEVVSTILLNFVALELLRYAVQGPLMETAGQFPQSEALPASLRLARLLPPARVHSGLWLVLVLTAGCHLLVYRTGFGFRMRAVASNLVAARFLGLDVARIQLGALAAGGALAGIGGVVELSGVTYRVYQNFSPGYGYTAIAVALMGRLHPVAIAASALVFGAIENGALAMQRQANVSSVIVQVIQGICVLTIAITAAFSLRRLKR